MNNKRFFIKYMEISLALLISFMCFIFAPLEIFITNRGEFLFEGSDVLYFAIPLFVVGFIFILLIQKIIRKINDRYYLYVYSILCLLTYTYYICGNYIPVGSIMDGNWEEAKKFTITKILPICIFMIAILVFAYICYKVRTDKIIKILSSINFYIIAIQLVTLMFCYFKYDDFNRKDQYVVTTDGEYTFSDDKNVVVLVLDSYQGKDFSKIINQGENRVKSICKDFVFFPDTVGRYSMTWLSIPNLISGQVMTLEDTYQEYLNRAFSESPLCNRFSKDGWKQYLHSIVDMPSTEYKTSFENIIKTKYTVSSHRVLAGYFLKLEGYRYLPYPLNLSCWFYPDDIRSRLISITDDKYEIYNWNNMEFCEGLDNIKVISDSPTYHFYHLEGVHNPYTINRNFEYDNYNKLSIIDEEEGMLVLIDEFINRLKEKNIYENTAIVIISDHATDGLRQNPLLLIKGMNESHDFEISDKAMSFSDLQLILDALANGSHCSEIINFQFSNIREYTYYDSDMESNAYNFTTFDYIVDGKAYDDVCKQVGEGYRLETN